MAESKPRCERRCIAETRHVRLHLHDDCMRGDRTDAGNVCQVHARNPEQLGFQIKRWLIACALINACLGSWWHLLRAASGARKLSYLEFELLVHLGNERLIEAVANKRLTKSE